MSSKEFLSVDCRQSIESSWSRRGGKTTSLVGLMDVIFHRGLDDGIVGR